MRVERIENGEEVESRGPSREMIETLCLLDAIGPDGCDVSDLAVSLGLSPSLASAVGASTTPLVQEGWIFREGARLTVTVAGLAWLEDRLAELLPERAGRARHHRPR